MVKTGLAGSKSLRGLPSCVFTLISPLPAVDAENEDFWAEELASAFEAEEARVFSPADDEDEKAAFCVPIFANKSPVSPDTLLFVCAFSCELCETAALVFSREAAVPALPLNALELFVFAESKADDAVLCPLDAADDERTVLPDEKTLSSQTGDVFSFAVRACSAINCSILF